MKLIRPFNSLQLKSPISISGGMNASFLQFRGDFTPRLNEVKASGGCHGFFNGKFSSGLEKSADTNSTGEFD